MLRPPWAVRRGLSTAPRARKPVLSCGGLRRASGAPHRGGAGDFPAFDSGADRRQSRTGQQQDGRAAGVHEVHRVSSMVSLVAGYRPTLEEAFPPRPPTRRGGGAVAVPSTRMPCRTRSDETGRHHRYDRDARACYRGNLALVLSEQSLAVRPAGRRLCRRVQGCARQARNPARRSAACSGCPRSRRCSSSDASAPDTRGHRPG